MSNGVFYAARAEGMSSVSWLIGVSVTELEDSWNSDVVRSW
jgi:hypothetical protein